MSKVQLSGNVNGTGVFTIASPNSNTDRTLTLPDNTGTLLTSGSSILASQLPAGTILQVVQGGTVNEVSTSGAETDTGVTANITPTSNTNKILVLVNLMGLRKEGGTGNARMAFTLYRGASQLIASDANMWTYTSNIFRHGGFAINYLDSPGTTSSLTYKVTFAGGDGSSFKVQADSNSGFSAITLLEVKV